MVIGRLSSSVPRVKETVRERERETRIGERRGSGSCGGPRRREAEESVSVPPAPPPPLHRPPLSRAGAPLPLTPLLPFTASARAGSARLSAPSLRRAARHCHGPRSRDVNRQSRVSRRRGSTWRGFSFSLTVYHDFFIFRYILCFYF